MAQFRAVRATTFSSEEGSLVARKPLRISTAPQIAATAATAITARRNAFHAFIVAPNFPVSN
jgi:hypothetical protein